LPLEHRIRRIETTKKRKGRRSSFTEAEIRTPRESSSSRMMMKKNKRMEEERERGELWKERRGIYLKEGGKIRAFLLRDS
jgi:hypothetical protein